MTAAIVGIGREIKAATTGLKDRTIWWRRSRAADLEPEDCAHDRSKPLEKNLDPWAVVIRAEPGAASDLSWVRVDRRVAMTEGPRR